MPDLILSEIHPAPEGGRAVALVRLNRPEALNALCDAMMRALAACLRAHDADPSVGAIVLAGGDKAFAAGADIREMRDRRYPLAAREDFLAEWEAAAAVRKPLVAAVAGYALGGGCELAMMCDLIVAAEDAVFGQPEITLGIIPGAGGTQRLTRALGKARAMDMVLTGRRLTAAEALQAGLISRVAPGGALLEHALAIAAQLAALSPAALFAAKRAVNRAFETSQAEGIGHERMLFHSLFGTAGQREGMDAFVEKRKPVFEG